MKKYFILIIFLLLLSFNLAQEETESIYPTTVSELSARVTIYGKGMVNGLKEGEEANFQIITFNDTPLQSVKIIKDELNIEGTPFYPRIVLDKFNNKYNMYTITKNGEFNYEIIADVNIKANIPELIDFEILEPSEMLKQYTQPSEKIESNSIEIINLVKNKLVTNNFVNTLHETVFWVNDYMEYAKGDEFNKYYLQQKTAVETLLTRKGVCDEFANLAAAMLRAKNIPTKMAIGITYDGQSWGNHAWLEVYNNKQNAWIPSDPTFREAGFVDATHIKMGSFSDISLSIAKATYPKTANITFDTQSKLPKVEIRQINYFNLITLNPKETELKTDTWNEVKVEMTNNSDRVITAPISILENYSEMIFQKKKQTETLKPKEKKEIIFYIYPKIILEENQYAKGTITFNSLSAPKKQPITIVKNPNTKIVGELIINDITPITHGEKLLIQIKATNYFNTTKTIDYNITSNSLEIKQTEEIPAFSSKIIETEIKDYENQSYLINIKTPTSTYTQTITTTQQTLIIQKPIEKQTVVEQKIDTSDVNTQGNFFIKNPLILMVGILIIVGLLLLGIFWTNKRYV
ncbi:MAG: transglutaminase-like domain-containing protein [Candidatus ainarchaeum sp.]|jgi:hypothetical protein|nr:transglutaminase-like domain-containing protein [Candidatus ainarchaeum sp.]MDD4128110.1 transglutaminase-like domain-containing protein [Candidatus ainarchaeum sp.]